MAGSSKTASNREHAFLYTGGQMFDLDPHWGPSWAEGTLKIGDWYLGTKKLPADTPTSTP